jgi:predicted RNase H-like nuclease
MDVTEVGSPSRSICLPKPLQLKWSISLHGCENARLILACVAIDIPIGLLEGPRACDVAARKLLGQPRGSSVFPAPCRAALGTKTYPEASATNRLKTTKGLSQQAWGITPKIKQVDDAITPDCQRWACEVHPGSASGRSPGNAQWRIIERHLRNRRANVGRDDLLDAAVAAWTALKICKGEARRVCEAARDERGLESTIWY